jgi:hypothetical protein
MLPLPIPIPKKRPHKVSVACENSLRAKWKRIANNIAVVAQREPHSQPNSKERSPAPIKICSEYDPDEEEEIEKEQAETMALSKILDIYKMYCNRFKNMPKHLAAFIISI